mgnify:CR=1 FL=1
MTQGEALVCTGIHALQAQSLCEQIQQEAEQLYEDEDNMLVYVFYNSNIDNNLKKLTREELLAKDWNYTRFIKKSLNITN